MIGVYILANFGERSRTPRILTMILGGTLSGLALIVALILGVAQPLRFNAGQVTADQLRVAEVTGACLGIGGLFGLLYLVPSVQRGWARILPLRVGSPVGYITLVIATLFMAEQIGTQLTVNVLELLKSGPPLTATDLLFQDIPLLALAVFGVGLFVRRSLPETLQRLGLHRPPAAYWWLVALIAIPVFMGVGIAIEKLASLVTPNAMRQVNDVSTALFSRLNNPVAIVFIGVLAGVVEEILFRGALLPRFGIILTALLFTALHTQYGITFASLEVFVLGVGLGWLRVRSGTLTCIVTHAGYDIAVGLVALFVK